MNVFYDKIVPKEQQQIPPSLFSLSKKGSRSGDGPGFFCLGKAAPGTAGEHPLRLNPGAALRPSDPRAVLRPDRPPPRPSDGPPPSGTPAQRPLPRRRAGESAPRPWFQPQSPGGRDGVGSGRKSCAPLQKVHNSVMIWPYFLGMIQMFPRGTAGITNTSFFSLSLKSERTSGSGPEVRLLFLFSLPLPLTCLPWDLNQIRNAAGEKSGGVFLTL